MKIEMENIYLCEFYFMCEVSFGDKSIVLVDIVHPWIRMVKKLCFLSPLNCFCAFVYYRNAAGALLCTGCNKW